MNSEVVVKKNKTLLWFRTDLRLDDNHALTWAVENSESILPVFIVGEEAQSYGGASKWWLHKSLASLQKSLVLKKSDLLLFKGAAQAVLESLVEAYELTAVAWNREYEPRTTDRDTKIKHDLKESGIFVYSGSGNVLREPWKSCKEDSTPYKVFTPFWRSLNKNYVSNEPLKEPNTLKPIPIIKKKSDKISRIDLSQVGLLPTMPWDTGLREFWQVGEVQAHKKLQQIISKKIPQQYENDRNTPSIAGTSTLSPYLRWGEVSPQRVWWNISKGESASEAEPFLRQLGWRDFAISLLFYFPKTVTDPLNPAFKHFPWNGESDFLHSWQRGLTGYPIVDAGMRQLWHIGWMHNRVRMIVGSVLVKHFLVDWREGAAWFWDTLVDADLANNTMGWQWIAGSGADAAPYFRIFNPMTQGEKFDPEGTYVRKWVPELKSMPSKYIHRPWEASAKDLEAAGVKLGKDYPFPIVSHEAGRRRALMAYEEMKQGGV
jgi:deoxyribodipyrimidine photo-lyase